MHQTVVKTQCLHRWNAVAFPGRIETDVAKSELLLTSDIKAIFRYKSRDNFRNTSQLLFALICLKKGNKID